MPDKPLQTCLVPGCGLRTFEPFCHGHWYAITEATRAEIYRLRTALKRVPVGGYYGRSAEKRRAKIVAALQQAYRRALAEIAAAAALSGVSTAAVGLAAAAGEPVVRPNPGGTVRPSDRGRTTEDIDTTGLEI